MEKELIEHKVEVDEYISAIIKIPKVLTALELKSLMSKANKLFNLAEVPIVRITRPYNKRVKHSGRGIRVYTPEMIDFIIRRVNSGDNYNTLTENFNNKFGKDFSKDKLMKKVYYIKNRGQWDKSLIPVVGQEVVFTEVKKRKYTKRPPFSNKVKNRVKELIENAKGGSQIFKILQNEGFKNLRKKSITDLTYRLKKEMRQSVN